MGLCVQAAWCQALERFKVHLRFRSGQTVFPLLVLDLQQMRPLHRHSGQQWTQAKLLPSVRNAVRHGECKARFSDERVLIS